MSVVYAREDSGDGSDKMDQIALDIEKAFCRLRCAARSIMPNTSEDVENAVCVIQEVADCLGLIQTEASDMAKMFHFYLEPDGKKAVSDAIDKFLENVEGNWPDRYFCTQVFMTHAVHQALRSKTAIADAVSRFPEEDRQKEARRRQALAVTHGFSPDVATKAKSGGGAGKRSHR